MTAAGAQHLGHRPRARCGRFRSRIGGDASFAVDPVFLALAGTGAFDLLAPDARTAFVEGATLATIINWTRFELAMSQRKALAATPNWALSNGSPKNWNEIFAFHWGPQGQPSVHAALDTVAGGPRMGRQWSRG
ncbi:hypothetical protein [Roseinatronobacter sp.]